MTKKKRVVILGAGISGLACGYFLSPTHEVTILEAQDVPGGWIQTDTEEGYCFERGPHTLRTSASAHLLKLSRALGLSDEIVYVNRATKKRYVSVGRKLRPLSCSYLLTLGWPLLVEWQRPIQEQEETIWEFATRRLGTKAAERLFDPLTLGVYAGDLRTLSMDACFPTLKRWEQESGSLTVGFLRSMRIRSQTPPPPLFSFRAGMQQLIHRLAQVLEGAILYRHPVTRLERLPHGWKIVSDTRTWEAEYVISALPPHILASLLDTIASQGAEILRSIPMENIAVVHLGYRNAVLKKPGFGFLVPSTEGRALLGVLFDSCLFPHQDAAEQMRFTALLRLQKDWQAREYIACATQALREECGITAPVMLSRCRILRSAIPQMRVGHAAQIRALLSTLTTDAPALCLAGNYLIGVSVNDCIVQAEKVAHHIFSNL